MNREHEKNETIENCFMYHTPKTGQQEKYQELRQAGKHLAYLMELHCPESEEYNQACIKLRECIMWANASIACNE